MRQNILKPMIYGTLITSVTAATAADLPPPKQPVILTETGRSAVVEMELFGAYFSRSGNAMAPSAGEDNFLPLMGGGALAAVKLSDQLLLQAELQGEAAFEDLGASDTYIGSFQTGGHFAYVPDNYLLGVFGGLGKSFVTSSDESTTYYFGGVEGKVWLGQFSLAGQAGYLDSSADDEEMMAGAWFGRAIGQMFLNEGRTMLQAEVSYADGVQDRDAGVRARDDITSLNWGLEIEQSIDLGLDMAAASLFAGYQGALIKEARSGGGTDRLVDHMALAGIKIRFGAPTPFDREQQTAPGLPNIGRMLGSTVAVD